MRKVLMTAALVALAGCEVPMAPADLPPVPAGKPLTVAVGRGGDRAKVIVRHEDGSAMTRADEVRALAKARTVACDGGRTAYEDKVDLADGAYTIEFFCAGIAQSDEVVVLPGAA